MFVAARPVWILDLMDPGLGLIGEALVGCDVCSSEARMDLGSCGFRSR